MNNCEFCGNETWNQTLCDDCRSKVDKIKIRCSECGRVFYFGVDDYIEVERLISRINDIMRKYYPHDVIGTFLDVLLARPGNLECCSYMFRRYHYVV